MNPTLNKKKSMPRHIIVKPKVRKKKNKGKKKILNQLEKNTAITGHFSMAIIEARRQWNNVFKV